MRDVTGRRLEAWIDRQPWPFSWLIPSLFVLAVIFIVLASTVGVGLTLRWMF